MPGCCAVGCTNRPEKGFLMKVFPRDPDRRKLWAAGVNREGWFPTDSSSICEIHFEPNMWEKVRVDGKRVLKWNAVPTIFSFEEIQERSWLHQQRMFAAQKVHFDESQFESHRADGLRKLKPNAIPTIFNTTASVRTYKRKPRKQVFFPEAPPKTEENEQAEKTIKSGVKTIQKGNEKQSRKENKGTKKKESVGHSSETLRTEEVVSPPETVPSPDVGVSKTGGKRQGRSRKKSETIKSSDWILEKPKTTRKKRGRPPKSSLSPAPKIVRVVSMSKDNQFTDAQEENSDEDYGESRLDSQEMISEESSLCFVCGKDANNGIILHTLTNTTKIYMHQKLDKIIRGEMELLIEEEGLLCKRCANLLNYIDRIEVELNMLNKAIVNCIRKKYGMGPRTIDKGQESLLPNLEENVEQSTVELVDADLKVNPTEVSNKWVERKDNSTESTDNIETEERVSDEEHTNEISDEIQCRICSFTTSYKSLMIYHLRQHLRETYSCDFCKIILPESATTLLEQGDTIGLSYKGHKVHKNRKDEVSVICASKDKDNTRNQNHNSTELVITVLPYNESDMIMRVAEEAIDDPQEQTEPEDVTVQLSNQNISSEDRTPLSQYNKQNRKQIRILNDTGMIVSQDLVVESEVTGGESMVQDEPTSSQLLHSSNRTSILGRLLDTESEQSTKCTVKNDKGVEKCDRISPEKTPVRVLSEVGIIEVTSVESLSFVIDKGDR